MKIIVIFVSCATVAMGLIFFGFFELLCCIVRFYYFLSVYFL